MVKWRQDKANRISKSQDKNNWRLEYLPIEGVHWKILKELANENGFWGSLKDIEGTNENL